MAHLYTGAGYGAQPIDPSRCRADVGRFSTTVQCHRTASILEDDVWWCGQHAPSAEQRRKEKKETLWRDEARRSQERATLERTRELVRLRLLEVAVRLANVSLSSENPGREQELIALASTAHGFFDEARDLGLEQQLTGLAGRIHAHEAERQAFENSRRNA